MRELPTTAPHEGLWVLYALRAAFAGTDSSSMPLTFRVSAGHFACFRVVSRSQIQRFRSSAPFLRRVRFPASSTERPRSGKSSRTWALFHQRTHQQSGVDDARMVSLQNMTRKNGTAYVQVLYRLNGKQTSTSFDDAASAEKFRDRSMPLAA